MLGSRPARSRTTARRRGPHVPRAAGPVRRCSASWSRWRPSGRRRSRYVFRGALLEDRLPRRSWRVLQLVPARDLRAEQRHDRFHDGDVDHLAPPGRLPLVEGRHDRERRCQRGDPVGQAERWEGRRPVRLTGRRREPAHRLGQRAEPGTAAIRADLSEAGDPGEDEARVVLAQPVVGQPPAFERVRTEVLDDDVRAGGEPAERLRPAGRRQVELDAALVATQRLVPEVVAVPLGSVAPGGVRSAGVLDLDDLGAQVAEVHRRHRAREEGRGVDDEQVVESAGHVEPPSADQVPRQPEPDTRRPPETRARGSGTWRRTRALRTPPSKYQAEPSLRCADPPLSMRNRVRPSLCSLSVRFQTSGPNALEAGRTGRQLPLVLGRQPGAGPARRTPGRRRGPRR